MVCLVWVKKQRKKIKERKSKKENQRKKIKERENNILRK
jgi:hypothetical protein